MNEEKIHISRNVTINPTIFGPIDYTVFVLSLTISAAIGVYFGFIKKNSNSSTDEYLHGGRKMKTLPIAISLIASQLSGMTIMTVPSEMYFYGTQYYLIAPLMVLITVVINYIFLPVFYDNNISNCNEYLQLRFSSAVKHIINALYIATSILIAPVFIYIPALAFSQATGFNVHLINAIVCSIGVFYTMVGGVKAVVWTDVIQAGIMLGSSLFIAFMGLYVVGGFSNVWDIADAGGRLELFNMNFDLTSRTTFWNSFLGYSLAWLAYVGLNQNCVQRMVAVPSLSHARNAMWLFCIGFILITSITCFTGLILYAHYHDCDPLAAGLIKKADQILPFFVQDVVGSVTGVSGLFNSCVFSAGLSTISAIMNATSGVIYQDYVQPLIGKQSERRAGIWMKSIVAAMGVYCIFMELIVARFSYILEIVYSVSALFQGPALGVFFLGMFWPWANKTGALYGTLVSMVCLGYIIVGNLVLKLDNQINYPTLNTTTEGCLDMGIEVPTPVISYQPDEFEFSIYRISFTWLFPIGAIIVWAIALPVSYFTMKCDPPKEKVSLFAPFVRVWVDKTDKKLKLHCFNN